jgi:tyrosinase
VPEPFVIQTRIDYPVEPVHGEVLESLMSVEDSEAQGTEWAVAHSHQPSGGCSFGGGAVGVRGNASTLTTAELGDLRGAFTAAYGLSDDRGYAFHAGLHGLPLPTYCEHGSLLFLPWHRAYLYFFERAITDALRRNRGDDTVVVSLPWWDWTSPAAHLTGLPKGYLADVPDNPFGAGPVSLDSSDLALVRERLPGAISDGPNPVTLRDPDLPGTVAVSG